MKFYKYMKKNFIKIFVAILASYSIVSIGYSSTPPIVSDSRIKTFIYNENEVFPIVVHYGYQSNIEFALNEKIDTLSIGNAYAWRITPAGRRIFIKPLEGSAHTNMTLITNKRTYQFDLESKDIKEGVDKNMVYVVRFYYPEDNFNDLSSNKVLNSQFNIAPKFDNSPNAIANIKNQNSPPSYTKNVMDNPSTIVKKDNSRNNYNYNYTLSGPETIAPLKVFDDGYRTYMEFPNNNSVVPNVFSVSKSGKQKRLSPSIVGQYVVFQEQPPMFSLKLNDDEVKLFNENKLGGL